MTYFKKQNVHLSAWFSYNFVDKKFVGKTAQNEEKCHILDSLRNIYRINDV
jgi:hypothetical protein